MLTRKKVIPFVSLVLLIGVLFLIIGTPGYQSIRIKNRDFVSLENKLKEVVNTNTKIDIKELSDFVWDECYVFNPYYPPEAIYKKVGTEWTTARTYIGYLLFHNMENKTVNDEQFIIVFKKSNKVILSAKYSLNQLPVIFKLDNYKFTSDNSKFIVSVAKQYDEGKIKELSLKK
ncbi:hypothetical protein ACJDU8_12045 [Clostridium sp. WILCCON 0269]|uniref:DUF4825 domain-containing protein n=1 Tax=Candidatus Clostridium eludens TaxID=3381663 RepID=A0ABW8SKI9_9CLOT